MALSDQQIYSLARTQFDPDAAESMTAIALAESSGNPGAYNGKPPDGSYGLWQINMYGALGPQRRQLFNLTDNTQLYDPATNARAAYRIWLQQGYAAWGAYTNGSYRQFLSRAAQARAAVEGAGPVPLPAGLQPDPDPVDTSIMDEWQGVGDGNGLTSQTLVFLAVGAAAVLMLLSLAKR